MIAKKKLYYFDTSIWLDLFEDRDEPNLPKGKWVHELIRKIISQDDKIIYSDAVMDELMELGYNEYELNEFLKPITLILVFVESTKKQWGRAKDLAKQRNIPIFDALHALIARDNGALMITRDSHFKKLLDINKYKRPEDFI